MTKTYGKNVTRPFGKGAKNNLSVGFNYSKD